MSRELKGNLYYKWAIFPFVIVIAVIESLWEGLKKTYNVLKYNFSEIKNTYF